MSIASTQNTSYTPLQTQPEQSNPEVAKQFKPNPFGWERLWLDPLAEYRLIPQILSYLPLSDLSKMQDLYFLSTFQSTVPENIHNLRNVVIALAGSYGLSHGVPNNVDEHKQLALQAKMYLQKLTAVSTLIGLYVDKEVNVPQVLQLIENVLSGKMCQEQEESEIELQQRFAIILEVQDQNTNNIPFLNENFDSQNFLLTA